MATPRKRRTGQQSLSTVIIENPGKGVNNYVSSTLIDDKESPDSRNIQIDESGIVKKRTGFDPIASLVSSISGPSTPILGLGTFYFGASSTRELLAVHGNDAYKWTGSGNWALISKNSGVSLTIGNKLNFVQAGFWTASNNNPSPAVYLHNGVNNMIRYDGTTLVSPPLGQKAKFGIFYNGYHIVSGNPLDPTALYISAPNTNGSNTQVFTGSGAATVWIGRDDGQSITGLTKFQDTLVIFKERSIYSMTFDSSGVPVIKLVNNSIGCVEHRTIDNVDNDVFFLDRNGVHVLGNEPNFFDTIRVNELSIRIKPTLDTISTANYSRCSALYSNYRYYLSIPAGGTSTNNRVLVYDKRYQAWEIWDTITASTWTEYYDSTNTRHLYWGDDNSGRAHEITTNFSDNNTAINGYWYSKEHDLGDGSITKQFIWVDFFFRQLVGQVTLTAIIDGDSITETVNLSSAASASDGWGSIGWGSGGWGDSSGAQQGALVASSKPYRLNLHSAKGRTIQLKVENNRNNETFALLKYAIGVRPLGRFNFPSSQKLN